MRCASPRCADQDGQRSAADLDPTTRAAISELRRERERYWPWMFGVGEAMGVPDRSGWWWTRARKLSGIDKKWRPHDLRHRSATVVVDQGHEVRALANRLGHANAAMTLRSPPTPSRPPTRSSPPASRRKRPAPPHSERRPRHPEATAATAARRSSGSGDARARSPHAGKTGRRLTDTRERRGGRGRRTVRTRCTGGNHDGCRPRSSPPATLLALRAHPMKTMRVRRRTCPRGGEPTLVQRLETMLTLPPTPSASGSSAPLLPATTTMSPTKR
jgi:Phage integrase family